ncbi:MAG: hypothetical protein ACK55Z_17755, partial [bacterium]
IDRGERNCSDQRQISDSDLEELTGVDGVAAVVFDRLHLGGVDALTLFVVRAIVLLDRNLQQPVASSVKVVRLLPQLLDQRLRFFIFAQHQPAELFD